MSKKPVCYLAFILLGLSVILAGCALDPTNSKYDLLFQITDVVNVYLDVGVAGYRWTGG